MKMRLKFVKTTSIILSLIFFASQALASQASPVYSSDTLATSLVSDTGINPERSASTRNDIAGKAEPGAIGKGIPLIELAQGKLPAKLAIEGEKSALLLGKLRQSIVLAIRLAISKKESVPSEHRARAEEALDNLISLQSNLASKAHFFTADVRGNEDYLLGFNFQGTVGLSVELIDRLYNISPLRLAQYIYHECVPEKGIVTERDDHRMVYNEIQSAIFGQQEVADLKKDLRNLITSFWVPSGIRALSVNPIQGVKTLSIPKYNEVVVCQIGKEDVSVYAGKTLKDLESQGNRIRIIKIDEDLSNLNASIEEMAIINPAFVLVPHMDDNRPFIVTAREAILERCEGLAKTTGIGKVAVFYETVGMVRQYNLVCPLSEGKMQIKMNAMSKYPSQIKRLPYDTTARYAMMANARKARLAISPDITGDYVELYQVVTIKNGQIQTEPADKYYIIDDDVSGCERFEDIEDGLVVVLAPHYDDAEIAAGGIGAILAEKNKLIVVDFTEGHRAEIPGVTDRAEKVRIREAEAAAASEAMGAQENIFLRLPFYDNTNEIGQRVITEDERENVYDLLRTEYLEFKRRNPSGKFVVLMPQEKDAHPDHVATHDIGIESLKRLSAEEGAEPTVLFYVAPWAGEANLYKYAPADEIERAIQTANPADRQMLEAMYYSGKAAAIPGTELTTAGGFGAKALTPLEIGGEYAERLYIKEIKPVEPAEELSAPEDLLSRITVSETEDEMGKIAAEAILRDMQEAVKERGKAIMLFASAPSQHSTWKHLLELWNKLTPEEQKNLAENIIAFHMDEYLGLQPGAEQLFGRVLRERVFNKLGIKTENTYYFNDRLGYETAVALRKAIDEGRMQDIERLTAELEREAQAHANQLTAEFKKWGGVFDIVVGGIGKLPHLAFNDPPEAKFNDTQTIKVVRLTETSRQQQVDDKEFDKISDVPTHALTFSVPPIISARKIHIMVPRQFKAESVRRTLDLPISENNPASGLRLPNVLPNVKIYLDRDSASLSRVARVANEIATALGKIPTAFSAYTSVEKDLPLNARIFKTNLIKILTEHKDRIFFIGIETDIGEAQKAQMMPVYKAIDQIENMTDSNGKRLFPNLLVRRANARDIVEIVQDLNERGNLDLNNVFIGARKTSVDENTYDSIKGEGRAWISAIDDSSAGDYIPVFEAITLNMLAYLNADLSAIKNFYDAISDKPIEPGVLQDMIRKRIIYILPRATKFDTKQLRELYELAYQIYTAA